MAKSDTKIVLKLSGNELQALIGNAGSFSECDGLMDTLYKFNLSSSEERKIYLTDFGFNCMYSCLLSTINGPRFPATSGKEYNFLVNIKEYMESEYVRQRGKQFSL